MSPIKTAALYGLVAALSVLAASKAVNFVANYQQWVTDRAYVKGRTMERLCGTDGGIPACEKHRRDTGHNIRPDLD